jgi:hypothetical protein
MFVQLWDVDVYSHTRAKREPHAYFNNLYGYFVPLCILTNYKPVQTKNAAVVYTKALVNDRITQ